MFIFQIGIEQVIIILMQGAMKREARIHQNILILFILTFNSAECNDLHSESFNKTTNSSVVEVEAIGNKTGKKNPK